MCINLQQNILETFSLRSTIRRKNKSVSWVRAWGRPNVPKPCLRKRKATASDIRFQHDILIVQAYCSHSHESIICRYHQISFCE